MTAIFIKFVEGGKKKSRYTMNISAFKSIVVQRTEQPPTKLLMLGSIPTDTIFTFSVQKNNRFAVCLFPSVTAKGF